MNYSHIIIIKLVRECGIVAFKDNQLEILIMHAFSVPAVIRGGIINACCTEKYIYCLAHDNSEKLTRDDFRKGQRNVFIFNWDGTPVRIIALALRIIGPSTFNTR
ncbi:MAG TPA: hypothetical protein DEQ09_13330 [Bacteroidales bacterium]|nr:hypothetical protein [Bacteroidales bacterium]